jgi:hypothetical protein
MSENDKPLEFAKLVFCVHYVITKEMQAIGQYSCQKLANGSETGFVTQHPDLGQGTKKVN